MEDTKHKLNAKQEVQTTLEFSGETVTSGHLGGRYRWEESGKISFWDVSFGMDLKFFNSHN